MSDQTVTLRITSDARGLVAGVEVVKRELGGLGGAGETAGRRTTAALQLVSPAIDGIRRSVTQLVGAYAGLQSVRALVTMADQYSNLSARLKLATSDASAYAVAQSEVFRIAQLTSTGLSSTATLYSRMSAALKDAGASQAELATITQTVNQALLVSGATTMESSSAIIQLSQAMASGVLRGEEFNSVNEAAPRLMQALAESIGVTRGELRKMAEAGEITAEVMRRALVDEAGKIAEEAAQMPLTIERAWQQLENAVTRYVGQADQAAGASSAIAQAIADLARNLESVEEAVIGVTQVLVIFAGARGIGAAVAGIHALREAMAAAALWSAWTGGAVGAASAADKFGSRLLALAGGPVAVAITALGVLALEIKKTWDALNEAEQRGATSIAIAQGSIGQALATSRRSIAGVTEDVERLADLMYRDRGRPQAMERYNESLVALKGSFLAAGGSVADWEELLSRSNAEAAAARNGASELGQAYQRLASIGSEMGVVQDRQAQAARTLADELRKLDVLEKNTPAIADDIQRRREALIATYQKSVASIGGLTQATKAQEKADQEAKAAAEALAGAQADHVQTMMQLQAGTSELAAAQMEYAATVAEALAVADEQRRAGLDEDSVRSQLLATIQAGQRALSDETAEIQRNADERARASDIVGNTLAQLEEEARTVNMTARERMLDNLIIEAQARARDAYNQGIRESIALGAEEIEDIKRRANASMDAIDAARASRDAAAEYQRVWTGSIDRVATAFGDWIAGGIKSFRDFRKAITDIARQALADIIAMFVRNKIMVSFGASGFGGPAMAGMPGIPGLPGMGGAGAGGIGGFFNGITTAISNGFGNVLSSVGGFFSQGAAFQGAGLLGSLGNFGSGMAAAGANVSGLGFFGSMGSNISGAFSAFGSGAIAQGLGQIIPVIGQIYAIAKLIDTISGGKLFGTSYRPESSSTTLSLGADGGDASASVREVRQRSLFRGRQWRNRSVDASDEAVQAADQLFDAVRQVMVSAAQAMQAEAPEMIDAALRTVQEYDSKGKLKATKYFVDVLGRTWEEASAEAAATRISAEALIATIDAALGTTVQAASEAAGGAIGGVIDGMADKVDDAAGSITPPFDTLVKSIGAAAGEASAIAERWRDDATVLMDGAQMMLAAATDIRRGAGLLGDGSLTSVVDLIEDMAAEGESLAAAYARVSAATALLQQALDLSGVALDKTREEFVRFAAEIAEAAGGIDRATQLWSNYFQTFFTEAERLQLLVSRAEGDANREFGDIGLNAQDFMGDGGAQAFRDMFEQVLPTLSADAVVQWLEAANALGIWIDASAALARASGDAAEAVTGVTQTLDELMADVASQLEQYAPPPTFAERMASITASTASLIERAVALGATEEQLAQIRALGAAQMQEVLDEQSAAMGRYQDIVRGLNEELQAQGLSEYQREIVEINRWLAETTSSMNEAARAAGLQGAAEMDLAMAHEIAAARAAAAIARLKERGRGVVERLYGTPLERLNEQIALLEQGMQGFAGSAVGGMEQVTQATDNAAQAQIGAQQRIREWLDNLMLGPLGGLRPRDALAEAQGQFQALLARALGGDAEAMAALPQLADQLLRLGQQVYASGEPYFDLRDQIIAAMQQVAALPAAAGGGLVPGGGGGGGGGSMGGGGAVGGDLQALYEERERLLAQQAAAERRELAMELAGIIRDLTMATGEPLAEIAATLGFTMSDLVADLGVNLSELNATTATQLGDIAQQMGVELTDLAASVGVDLGELANRQSLLNDALEAEITGLPQRERDMLEPLLRNVEEAAALGDTEGVEAGIGEMERAIQDMAPEIRDALAPYFLAIRPADPTTELQHIASIDTGIASAVAQLGMQTMSLGRIAHTLTSIEAALVGGRSTSVPSYDVGTAFVPRTGLAMIHRGETILPAPVAAFFRRVGIPMPVPVPAAKAAAARDDRVIAGAIRDGNAAVVTELRALTGRVERLESTTRETGERQTRALDRQTDAMRTR